MTISDTMAEMRYLMRRRFTLQEQLERARSAATASGGIGDGMPHGTAVSQKVERYGLYIADLTEQIEQIDRKLDIYAVDVQKAITRVVDARDAEILRLRYLERKSVSDVGRTLHYKRQYVYDLIRKAEQNI